MLTPFLTKGKRKILIIFITKQFLDFFELAGYRIFSSIQPCSGIDFSKCSVDISPSSPVSFCLRILNNIIKITNVVIPISYINFTSTFPSPTIETVREHSQSTETYWQWLHLVHLYSHYHFYLFHWLYPYVFTPTMHWGIAIITEERAACNDLY